MVIKLQKKEKILLICELAFMAAYIIMMCGRQKIYEFDRTNLEIYDDSIVYSPEDGSYTATWNGVDTDQRAMLGIARMEIESGAYEVTVRYTGSTGIGGQTGNCLNKAGVLKIRSFLNPTEVGYDEIELVDGDNVKTGRLYITSLGSIDDLDVKIYFNGQGVLKIDQLVFREMIVWRVMCALKWVLVLVACNACYFYFVRRNDYKDKHIAAGIVFAIVFSSLLAFQNYIMGGHDLLFHLLRIQSIGKAVAAGKWISPVYADAANGYGYAAPLFYGQLFLYIPAVLYNMAVPLHICYQIYVVCVNAATCLVSYACFKAIVKNKEIALIGAYCYQFSAYRIIDVYIRAAVGEYTAMIFLPLVLYGFYRVYTEEADKLSTRDAACIIFGLGGIIQSHLITAELAAFSIVLLCAVLLRKTFEKRRFLTLAGAAVLTVMCNLGFLLPFLDSMSMDIAVNARIPGRLQELGAVAYQVFGVFMHPNETYTLGIALMAGTALFAWCFVKRFEWGIEDNRFLKTGAIVFPAFVMSVIFSFSSFPWDSFSTAGGIVGALGRLVAIIQFPWRFHIISTLLGVFLTVLGIAILHGCGRALYGYAMGGIAIFLMFLNVGMFYAQYPAIAMKTRWYSATDNEFCMRIVSGGEYRLEGTDFDLCMTKEVIAQDDMVKTAEYKSGFVETTFACVNESDSVKYVDIPLFCYDNYRVYDAGSGNAIATGRGENNRIRIFIEGGYSGNIRVVYHIPLAWRVSYIVSALTVLGIVLYIAGFLKVKIFGGQNEGKDG